MYAVIFRARLNKTDQTYRDTASRLRELAMNRYGCIDFISMTEGDREIAISYWASMDEIAAWKQDAEHQQAQHLGRTKWYRSYSVQILRVEHEYDKLPP